MKLMKYSNVLKMAKEKIQEALAPIRANEMKKKAELEIAKLDGVIAEQEQKIQELASQYPIDFDAICEATDELDLKSRRRKQLNTIIEDLFN